MMNALFGKDEMESWQWPALPSGQTLCQWWRPCTDRGNSVIIIVITIIVVVIVIIIKIVVILVIAVKIIARNHRQLVISFIWRIQRCNCIHATHCNQHSSCYVCNAKSRLTLHSFIFIVFVIIKITKSHLVVIAIIPMFASKFIIAPSSSSHHHHCYLFIKKTFALKQGGTEESSCQRTDCIRFAHYHYHNHHYPRNHYHYHNHHHHYYHLGLGPGYLAYDDGDSESNYIWSLVACFSWLKCDQFSTL